jgi:hypothetical protein
MPMIRMQQVARMMMMMMQLKRWKRRKGHRRQRRRGARLSTGESDLMRVEVTEFMEMDIVEVEMKRCISDGE